VTAVPADDDTAPQPIGRYEWERILRRAVLPKDVKYIALLLATWADPDGTRVRPGVAELAASAEQGEATVRRRVAVLRDLGFLILVSRGGGRGGAGKAAEYRLSLPADLLERVELRPPGGGRRGLAPVSPLTQVSAHSAESSVDNPDSPISTVSAQSEPSPVDNSESPITVLSAQSTGDKANDRSNDTVTNQLSDQNDELSDHLGDRLPATYTNHKDHPPTPDPTQPPTARDPTAPADLRRPTRCPHGQPQRTRRDGKPKCATCRRENPAGGEPP
jgi:hypothetical protein